MHIKERRTLLFQLGKITVTKSNHLTDNHDVYDEVTMVMMIMMTMTMMIMT